MDESPKSDVIVTEIGEELTSSKPTEARTADLLPNCVTKETKNVVMRNGVPYVPIFCANCGCDGGWVPQDSIEATGFAFYLCNPCAEKWAPLAGTYMVPDDVFWEKVKQTQIETYGRELSGEEVAEALKDDQHILTKLARDRFDWKKAV